MINQLEMGKVKKKMILKMQSNVTIIPPIKVIHFSLKLSCLHLNTLV